MSYWKDLFDKNLKNKLKDLDNCIEDQSKFAQLVADLINNLDFEDSEFGVYSTDQLKSLINVLSDKIDLSLNLSFSL